MAGIRKENEKEEKKMTVEKEFRALGRDGCFFA